HIRNLNAARLAADVMGTPTLVVARTDAEAAKLLTSDIDERDRPFVDYDAGRTVEGFYHVRNGIEPCIARAVAYAPHADLIWCETSKPDLEQAKK
ncbi:isocitrate lyase, partial [bacterium M00.F.Ca.ET.230.01.1.1]